MKVGIAGFPGAGKTTIFNALTGLSAEVGPGAGARARPNRGVIKVPDPRVDALAEVYSPRKKTYAEISFVDFPDPPGESGRLDPQVVSQMREVDALAEVVRAFDDPSQPRPVDPLRDMESFRTELIVADLAVIERRLERLRKERGHERERALLERLRETLESEQELRALEFSTEEEREIAGFGFLSRKPRLVVLNVAEDRLAAGVPPEVATAARRAGMAALAISGPLEREMADLEPADRHALEADLGIEESARDRFVRACYALLDLISFLTAGEDEVRAWTIRRGDRAPTAAGKVHSDIERGFIRAEVVSFEDLVRLGSEARCREAGKLRVEGKEYVVADGDVVHFRFHV